MADDEFEIVEVEIEPPHNERVMDVVMGERNAEAYINMAVMRRGVDTHFYKKRPR